MYVNHNVVGILLNVRCDTYITMRSTINNKNKTHFSMTKENTAKEKLKKLETEDISKFEHIQ